MPRLRTGLRRHSNASLFGRGNFAGKKFRDARDRGRVFCDTGRFRTIETALSRVSGGKAKEEMVVNL
jgi:hypothetical protein